MDDPINKFLPTLPEWAGRVTVRHLLHHSSGVRDYLQLAYLKGIGDYDYYTDKDLMSWLERQTELNFAPNEDFNYSNSGYWLLGQISEKRSWEKHG